MGEQDRWPDSGGPSPNGLLSGARSVMRPLDIDRWLRVEDRTAELIACIQPNQLSEERRNAVADYVQRLIMKCFPCQVCTFGSVPLKTYLPDGDIDLTAFSHNQNLKDTWANQVRDMLENEEKNENAEFHVKEVQYIQAEVKIIKCLVENIVVDISFNQVGGLCTLCFLDEVDSLINQNHLFKRSIILIKAWCYYESRILGAHHGLISTYALETLVLYIFHVFNNSFQGPLEVLYRFLEFFSNFDWDNFCVSLWGPVPISSLPDVTAEPPRKDTGELLLSKLFLDACSSVYAVFPGGHENNGQPFVSKHFNVIDPLRVNNNLGRSVSKGNFFRIRSAFSFGAKKLARLLDCPKGNLVFEVDQFFMNTWERHGSGRRPDAPGLDSWRLGLSTPDSPEEFDNSNNTTSGKKVNKNASVHGMESERIRGRGVSTLQGKYSARMTPITGESSAVTQTLHLKTHLSSLMHTVKPGIEITANQLNNEKVQRELVNDTQGQGRFIFARTRSSPELTDACDASTQVRHNNAESTNSHVTNARLDSNRRNNLGSESLASHSSRSSVDDTIPARHGLSHESVDGSVDSRNSYHRELGLDILSEDLSSSATQMMNQEEQDIVNMMASASLQGFNGRVHTPFNLSSGHLPFPIHPSFLASMGYSQRNLPGFVPANFPVIDPSFSNMQFPHGLVPPQLAHYFPGTGLNTPTEDSVERSNENFGAVHMNSGEADTDFWQEDVASPVSYEPENGNFDMSQSDDKQPASSSSLKYVPPFRMNAPGSGTRVQQKHSREKSGSLRESIGSLQVQDIRGSASRKKDLRSSDVSIEERSASSRFSSATRSNSLRSRTSSESSWDESVKMPKSTKEKRGKKVVSTDLAASHGKGKLMSGHVSNQDEDDDQMWGTSFSGSEMAEKNPGSEPVASMRAPRHNVPGSEVAQTSGSESMMPFAPVLIGPGSRQRVNDTSGLIAFYPTGPPIPFLTMLPVYNVPPTTGTPDVSSAHFGGDESLDNSVSGQNFSPERFDPSEDLNSSSSLPETTNTEPCEEHKADILNSDFASHWQNLQFGRLCQNIRYPGPVHYPSPIMVPPVYLQGRFPYDNPGRPVAANTNILSQLVASYGQRLVPVAPLQSASTRPPNMYQPYMDEMPRYRMGTGTYLPNPVSVRERHSSGTRRGNYNHDRNDSYVDREGNRDANLRPRASGRGHSRSQADRVNSRIDRLAPSEGRADRSWNSFRHDLAPLYHTQNGPSHPNSSQNDPQDGPYSMYPSAAMNPNGVSNGPVPPVVMLYPLDHNATYGSHGEPLEFGSLGPVGFSGINDQSQPIEGTQARPFEGQRLHGNSRVRSSPDQPSSPRHQRRN